jgi:MarR family transcriptional regulator, 2-MHQ and catechol-resistance regulon repressor
MNETSLIEDQRITTFGRLVEAYAVLRHRLDDELQEEVGLPLLWYGVLLHVGRSPRGVRPMSELTEATAFTSGGVTRLVDRMEAAGYVERRPCPTDRRVQFVGLTDTGREMLERASEIHVRGIQEHMLDRLSPDEVQKLDRLLCKLVHGDHQTSDEVDRK